MILKIMLSAFLAELLDFKDSLGSKILFFLSSSLDISGKGKGFKIMLLLLKIM
jgi:hypothetical protein